MKLLERCLALPHASDWRTATCLNRTIVFALLACGLPQPRNAVSQEAPLKATVILDEVELRFPDPIFGFMHLENASNSPQFIGLFNGFSGTRIVTFGDKAFEVDFPPNHAPDNSLKGRVAPGFSSTYEFAECIKDSALIESILKNGQGSIQFYRHAHPKEVFPLETPSGPYTFYARDGFEAVAAAPVEVRYSLDDDIFRDDVPLDPEDGFSMRMRDPSNWLTDSQLRARDTKKSKRRSRNGTLIFGARMLDSGTELRLPVLHVFPGRFDELQATVRCDTATWRTLEIRRLLLTQLTQPQTHEAQERLANDLIAVLRCCGLAEAYSYTAWIDEEADRNPGQAAASREGTRRFADVWRERLAEKFPGYRFLGSNTWAEPIPENQRSGADNAKETRFDYIDVSMPSPRQRAMKLWEDSGRSGPSPCPCESPGAESETPKLIPAPEADPFGPDPFGGGNP